MWVLPPQFHCSSASLMNWRLSYTSTVVWLLGISSNAFLSNFSRRLCHCRYSRCSSSACQWVENLADCGKNPFCHSWLFPFSLHHVTTLQVWIWKHGWMPVLWCAFPTTPLFLDTEKMKLQRIQHLSANKNELVLMGLLPWTSEPHEGEYHDQFWQSFQHFLHLDVWCPWYWIQHRYLQRDSCSHQSCQSPQHVALVSLSLGHQKALIGNPPSQVAGKDVFLPTSPAHPKSLILSTIETMSLIHKIKTINKCSKN